MVKNIFLGPKFAGIKTEKSKIHKFESEPALEITDKTLYVYLVKDKRACIILGYRTNTTFKVLMIAGTKGKLNKGSRVIKDQTAKETGDMLKIIASWIHQRIHKKCPYKIETVYSYDVALEQQLKYLISLEPCKVPYVKLENIAIADPYIEEICSLVELQNDQV